MQVNSKLSALSLVKEGRNILNSKSAECFRSQLRSNIERVFGRSSSSIIIYEDHLKDVLLEGWIDEFLRFLVIASVQEEFMDVLPSYPIMEICDMLSQNGNRLLCRRLCRLMVGEDALALMLYLEDMDFDTASLASEGGLHHCFNYTVEFYSHLFHENPPSLFWLENFEDNLYEPVEEEETGWTAIFKPKNWCYGVGSSCDPIFERQVICEREVLI